ncbi:MAG TPA: class I SAM-dependent methyltransferase [Nitrosomonas sp.]|nr:class I SAM-dependent methyltransferase [Nitrosomonas sp.]HRB32300.1 class I SAM-dependent methyltransferase [Nitrosomonas sp.]HRB44962.1 class I SAM-dependent methyltransferase [Nitrosomonas sp.]HRB77233.1 class I SAM-dependent methyltransferase [Nitrosomonas sp.]
MTQNTSSIATETNATCYLCHESSVIIYQNCMDRLFGAPGKWSFRKCTAVNCGHIWLDPRPVVNDIGKVYQTYYTHTAEDSHLTGWLKFLRTVLHKISILGLFQERKRYKRMYLDDSKLGKLLEVGCGNGKRLDRLRKLGWKVTGQEIDPVASEWVTQNLGIDMHLGPLENMSVSEPYDVILMSHVIEHVHDPLALLSTCDRLLKPDGVLILLTPNAHSCGHRKFAARWRGLEPPRHLHLFTPNNLRKIIQKAGFKRIQSWTTPIGAFAIGQNSFELTNGFESPHRSVTYRDIVRGFWFQLFARMMYVADKQSGEECVVIARKQGIGVESS